MSASCIATEKKEKMTQAVKKAVRHGKRIRDLLKEVELRGNKWSFENALDMEQAAMEIIKAIKEYKENNK